jgi:hypothetical protein
VQGGHAEISRTTIRDNSSSGISAYGGAVVYLNDSTVTRNGTALSLSQGSSAAVRASRLAASTGGGVTVDGGSALTLWAGAIVEDSGRFAGVSASGNSSIIMQDQSAVQGNRGDGIKLSETAELFLNDTPLIENNEGWGVVCVPVPDVPGIHGGWGLDPAKIGPNGAGRISCPGLTAP